MHIMFPSTAMKYSEARVEVEVFLKNKQEYHNLYPC